MGPGTYLPDVTEGITRAEDLPQPLMERRSRNYRRRSCPQCGRSCLRHSLGQRVLHDLGRLRRNRPRALPVVYSKHRCPTCQRCFNADRSDLAPRKGAYTHRVLSLAVRLVIEEGLPYRTAAGHLWRDHRVLFRSPRFKTGSRRRGKKASAAVETRYLDWALADFSGYLAIDEPYDGPFCVLSAVDSPRQPRLLYAVRP